MFAMSPAIPDQHHLPLQAPLLTDPPPPVAVRSFGLTDRGRVRPTNEDQFLIAEMARTLWVRQASLPQPETHHGRNRGHVFLVADGMGGHQAGEVASALSVATIETFVLHVLHRFSNLKAADEQGVVKDFQAALRQADARIAEEAARDPARAGMGTTLTLAFVTGWKLFVLHAGDCRCYLFRRGDLRQLTADHTVAVELARQGVIRPEEVRCHPYRHTVTQFLGRGNGDGPFEVHRADLETGDVLLLCSDGLSDMLADDRIAAVLAAESDPRSACERLVAEANARGGRDNITAVVARFEAV
jgi:serine/threonine protein phosphatase PrpC